MHGLIWRLATRLGVVRPRLGVVLGGGANLGAFEVGVIDVLSRRGIVPDLLVGTSVGAINAAFWALDPAAGVGDRMLPFWLEADRSTMFPDGPVPMVGRFVQGKDHLTTQRGVARAIGRVIPEDAAIEDARIPLAIVAADAAHGDRLVLRRGPLLPAILASSALPVLFPPVEIGGWRLMDGGVVANCDVEAAVEAGMSDVVVVDPLGDGPANGEASLMEVAERAVVIMLRRQTDLAVAAFERRARIAMLRPRLDVRPRLGDFSRTMELYRSGQAAAEAFMPTHLRRGRRVRPGLFEFAGNQTKAPTVVRV